MAVWLSIQIEKELFISPCATFNLGALKLQNHGFLIIRKEAGHDGKAVLIKGNNISNFASTWKLLLDFMLVTKTKKNDFRFLLLG